MSTTLAVSHNIYLTREERDKLLEPEGSVTVVGVSVPVWYYKGMTSEPAIEVFSKYRLVSVNDVIYVKHNGEGYEMTIPPKSMQIEKLPDDMWNSLSREEQDHWYETHEPAPSLANLQDIKKGGSEWLAFRQYSKVKRNKKTLNVIHYIEIKLVGELMDTLS